MLTTFLLVVHILITIALVAVILLQRSEGGGLGIGGGPTGLMTARGAANLLTRATTVLATLFIGLTIALAVLGSTGRSTRTIDTSVAPTTAPLAPAEPAAPADGALLPPGPDAAPAPADDVPLAQ